MTTIRINSLVIHVEADKFMATEWEVRRPGKLFVVTAHCRQDAEDAVAAYREPDSNSDKQLAIELE